MRIGEHPSQRGEVAPGFQLQEFEQQVGLVAGDAVRERLGCAQPGIAQGHETIGFRGERVLMRATVDLQEPLGAGNRYPIAAVNAAAGDRFCGGDAQLLAQRGVHAGLNRSELDDARARAGACPSDGRSSP